VSRVGWFVLTADGRKLLNQRGLEDDAAVNRPGGPAEDLLEVVRHLWRLGELAEDVDQAPHRPDEIAFMAPERLGDDPRPVIISGGPSIDRGKKARVD